MPSAFQYPSTWVGEEVSIMEELQPQDIEDLLQELELATIAVKRLQTW
jgi:hypothetical protein